jgi:hypothetical protein
MLLIKGRGIEPKLCGATAPKHQAGLMKKMVPPASEPIDLLSSTLKLNQEQLVSLASIRVGGSR